MLHQSGLIMTLFQHSVLFQQMRLGVGERGEGERERKREETETERRLISRAGRENKCKGIFAVY